MPCLTLWPAPTCGFNGRCVPEENGTDEFCVCDDGFSQSLEFSFFVDEPFLNSSICIYNENAVSRLYMVLVALAIFTSCMQILKLENQRQVRRQLPHIGYSVFITGESFYRVYYPDKALCGVDPVFTLVFSQCAVLAAWQGYIFLSKYLRYVAKKVQLDAFFLRAEAYQRVYFYVLVIHSVSVQLFWISTWMSRDRVMIVFQFVFTVQVLRVAFQIAFFQFALSELSKDMRKLLDFDDSTKMTKSGIQVFLEKNIDGLEKRRRVLVASGILEITLWATALASNFFFLCWSYMLPVLGQLMFVYALAVIIESKRKGILVKYIQRFYMGDKGKVGENDQDGIAVVSETTYNSRFNDSSLAGLAGRSNSEVYASNPVAD
uniref:Uncharacterized protein n=1 Tax=Aplanochytrium stocchinoi TaxID=215587 RepID=A0A7S3V2B6_9STRA